MSMSRPNQKGMLTASNPVLSGRQNHTDPNHQKLNLGQLLYSPFRGLKDATN